MNKINSILMAVLMLFGVSGSVYAVGDSNAAFIVLNCDEKEEVCHYGKVVEISLKCSGPEVDGKVEVAFEDQEFDLWASYDGNEFCDFDHVEIESDKTEVKCQTKSHKAALEINHKEKECPK